jgi:outer membrane protein
MKTTHISLLLTPLVMALSAPALAGEYEIGLGGLHINPQDHSHEMQTVFASGKTSTSSGTKATISNADTLGLTLTYVVDDKMAVQFVGGIPPKFELRGSGQSLLGDLGSFDYLATTKLYSPTLLGIYSFGDASWKLRPYLGLGATYTHFGDVRLNKDFEASAKSRGSKIVAAGIYAQSTGRDLQADSANGVFTVGSPNFNLANAVAANNAQTAAASVPVGVRAEADDSLDPTVVLGLDYRFSEHWAAQASVSWLPLNTKATIYLRSPNGELAHSSSEMTLNPITSYLGVSYRF